MERTLALCLALLLPLPLALAHDVAGTPRTTCERPSDWRTHDYNMDPPETGVYAGAASLGANAQGHGVGAHRTGKFMNPYLDGNLDECGTTFGLFLLTASDCNWLAHFGLSGPAFDLACRTDGPADYDGHHEFGYVGRALLVSRSGDGVTGGGIACYDEQGHHPTFGIVSVSDIAFPHVVFAVAADFSDPAAVIPPGTPDCGDGLILDCGLPPGEEPVREAVIVVNDLIRDLASGVCTTVDSITVCVDSCTIGFLPGADGAYHVRIGATTDGFNGGPTGADQGHVTL